MATEGDEHGGDARAARATLDEALARLPQEDRAGVADRVVDRIVGIGLQIGLTRPREAARLLELIEAGELDRADPGARTSSGSGPGGGAPSEAPVASGSIPVGSTLLARAASSSVAELERDPGSRFGWAARLTRAEVLALGQVVDEMLARGVPPNIARGFGLAWDAGVSLPRGERRGLFAQFADLEITVGGVLVGRDLRAAGTARPTGLEGLVSSWFSRPRVGDVRASAAIGLAGETAKRSLVALWNAWIAMRYRDLIPRPTFELLVEPWVTAIGPLPEP